MPRRRPLHTSWTAYLVTRDALKVTQRASQKGQRQLFNNLTLLTSAPRVATFAISAARDHADELIILAMWAEFERFVIEFLEGHADRLRSRTPRRVWGKLGAHIAGQVEYWREDDCLDILKGIVDPIRIGQAKQVKDFRDWVAHKNPKKRPSAVIDPATAYQLLTEIILAMERYTTA